LIIKNLLVFLCVLCALCGERLFRFFKILKRFTPFPSRPRAETLRRASPTFPLEVEEIDSCLLRGYHLKV
jgi:hypothetical protein